jgi:hypothetical protein
MISLSCRTIKAFFTSKVFGHRPEQKRVTWETPSSEAFVPLHEPVGVLTSYIPPAQMQVWSEQVWLNTTFISHRGINKRSKPKG